MRSAPSSQPEPDRASPPVPKLAIAQFGLGPIGIESVRLSATKPWVRIVGAVDIDPGKAGRPVAEVAGIGNLDGGRVYGTFAELLEDVRPQVVLHTAGSRAAEALAQIEPMCRRGISVASTCEELLYPMLRAPEEARRLDDICRESGSRVVGTGVNPGFVMDVLPICLSGVCRSVVKISAWRVVDASSRRKPLQRKIGSGLEPQAFNDLVQRGCAGHAGFRESASLIAHAMAWKLDDLQETCEPVIAVDEIRTEHFQVQRGFVSGLHQRCIGRVESEVRIELDLSMYLGAPDPHDAVRIEGDPRLEVRIPGGVAGDQATVAALVNVVPRLVRASPGLRLMTDLAVPAFA